MEAENYHDTWNRFPGTEELYEGEDPHGKYLTIYVNDIAYESIMAGNTPLPDGSMIAKQNYTPDSTLASITTMYKVEDYNPAHNDWFWLKNDGAGVIEAEGRVDGCQNCHGQVSASDYIFTTFPE